MIPVFANQFLQSQHSVLTVDYEKFRQRGRRLKQGRKIKLTIYQRLFGFPISKVQEYCGRQINTLSPQVVCELIDPYILRLTLVSMFCACVEVWDFIVIGN